MQSKIYDSGFHNLNTTIKLRLDAGAYDDAYDDACACASAVELGYMCGCRRRGQA